MYGTTGSTVGRIGWASALLLVVLLPRAARPVPTAAPPTASAVERFVDEHWAEQDNRRGTPGFVLAYVDGRGERLVMARGVGNVDERAALDPHRDIFRVGSVSKVFVGLAAARLIERGAVDPQADVAGYLDFDIEGPFDKPITLHHLLTHTAGLDDRYFADTSRTRRDQEPLGAHLAARLPPRIYPAGHTMSYSNYGFALAAHVLERAAGVDFADYVSDEILAPLGMRRSGFRRTEEAAAGLVTGYDWRDGAHVAQPYTYTHRYPSTTFMTSAADMATLLEALLDEECGVDRPCVWRERARALILERQEALADQLPGRTYAFSEWTRHCGRALWHDGGTAGFAAELILFPGEGVGLFVADNLQPGGFSRRLKMALLDRFFAGAGSVPRQAEVPPAEPTAPVGFYARVRRSHRSIEKLRLLTDGAIEVVAEPDGALTVFGDWRFVPVGADLYQRAPGDGRYLVFGRDDAGRVDRALIDWGGMTETLSRLSFWERPRVFMWGTGLALLVLTATSLYWLLRWRGPRAAPAGFVPCLIGLTTASWVFLVGVAFSMLRLDPLEFRFGEAAGLHLLLCLPLLAAPLAVCLLVQSVRLVVQGRAGIVGQAVNALTISAVGLFYWLLRCWNLLGFRL